MLIVIADDLTGAAELCGVGLRFGLSVELQTEFSSDSDAGFLVVDTDSRSDSPVLAAQKVESIAKQIYEMREPWIYKKTDSVLRGNVRVELQALLKIFDRKTVLLIPANPSFGRTISDGKYFIQNKPLNQTDFANDPEHPIKSSDVLQLLGSSAEMDIRFIKREDAIPKCDIAIGETENQKDLVKWACQTHAHILPAGGSEFFYVLLKKMGMSIVPKGTSSKFPFDEMALIVCGSASDYSRKIIAQARKNGKPVCDMPEELFNFNYDIKKYLERWTNGVVAAYQKNKKVIIAINHQVVQNAALAKRLVRNMSMLVESVLGKIKINELIIEGGATAAAIVHRLQWKKFYPTQEIVPGVVRMQVAENPKLCITIKPGSYPWHDNFLL
ncbi:MAG: hypothetical protein JSW07_12265 [bacterium]|nr:MAG: hypothetical protein JSW07_12265 [bacterium]